MSLLRGARIPPAAIATGCSPPGRARRRSAIAERRPVPMRPNTASINPKSAVSCCQRVWLTVLQRPVPRPSATAMKSARARSTRRRAIRYARPTVSDASSELESFAISPGARGARISTMPVFQRGYETPRRLSQAPVNTRIDSVHRARAGSRIARAAVA